MKTIPLPLNIRCAWGLAALALLAATSPIRAEDLRMIEARGHLVYATEEQMKAALGAAHLVEKPGGPLSSEQFAALRRELKDLHLEFFSQPSALFLSGQKTTIEAVREFRYPAKYVSYPKLGPNLHTAESFPAAFVMRDLGVTLEFIGTITPDDAVDLTFSAKVVELLGFTDNSIRKSASANPKAPLKDFLRKSPRADGASRPVFSNFEGQANACLRDGQTALLSGPFKVEPENLKGPVLLPRRAPADQMVFVFVTAKALPQK